MNYDQRIAELKSNYSQTQLAKARAEALNESAKQSLAQHLDQLKAVYGLDSLDDARAKLAELQNDLDTKLAQGEDNLNSIKL